jgi:hypothetical protein
MKIYNIKNHNSVVHCVTRSTVYNGEVDMVYMHRGKKIRLRDERDGRHVWGEYWVTSCGRDAHGVGIGRGVDKFFCRVSRWTLDLQMNLPNESLGGRLFPRLGIEW